jgi:hypothetical protein
VAYLSTNFGVDCLLFYFIVHMACNCMDVIRLDGNVDQVPLPQVSVSYESMTIQ